MTKIASRGGGPARKAKHCEFSALEESLIRDRIVAGVRNDSLRVRLLRDTTLDLKTAIEASRAAEASVTELFQLQRPPKTPPAAEVHSLKQQQPQQAPWPPVRDTSLRRPSTDRYAG